MEPVTPGGGGKAVNIIYLAFAGNLTFTTTNQTEVIEQIESLKECAEKVGQLMSNLSKDVHCSTYLNAFCHNVIKTHSKCKK